MAEELGYRMVDADNHYFEPDDCFSRHIESRYRDQAIRAVREADGTGKWFIGDRPQTYYSTIKDHYLTPGALAGFLQGVIKEAPVDPETVRSDQPEFCNRAARLAKMDEFGVEAAFFFPTAANTFEIEMWRDDPEVCMANFRSFNRWLQEDWGFAYDNRIFAAPYISLADIDLAVAEVDRVLEEGARMVMIRSGPIMDRSPADPYFDPFWARCAEAKIPVTTHVITNEYNRFIASHFGEDPQEADQNITPLTLFMGLGHRPLQDSLAAMICHNLFGRFPDLQFVTVEHGSDWAKRLTKLDRFIVDAQRGAKIVGGEAGTKQFRYGVPTKTATQVLRENVLISPFHEDDLDALIALVGADRVLFGSDWPHEEGVVRPIDFRDGLKNCTEDVTRLVMRDNAATMVGIPV